MAVLTGEEARQLAGLLHDINQDLKRSKSDSTYSVARGKFVSYKSGESDLAHNVCRPKLTKARQKFRGLQEALGEISGFVDGNELYQFLKANKKYVTEVELGGDFFVIRTSLPEVEYRSGKLSESMERDIYPWRDFAERTKRFRTRERLHGRLRLEKEDISSLLNARTPTVLACGGVKAKVTQKVFVGLKADSECELLFFTIDEARGLYLVDAKIEAKHFSSDNYFAVVNY